jgi:hypothetical protein
MHRQEHGRRSAVEHDAALSDDRAVRVIHGSNTSAPWTSSRRAHPGRGGVIDDSRRGGARDRARRRSSTALATHAAVGLGVGAAGGEVRPQLGRADSITRAPGSATPRSTASASAKRRSLAARAITDDVRGGVGERGLPVRADGRPDRPRRVGGRTPAHRSRAARAPRQHGRGAARQRAVARAAVAARPSGGHRASVATGARQPQPIVVVDGRTPAAWWPGARAARSPPQAAPGRWLHSTSQSRLPTSRRVDRGVPRGPPPGTHRRRRRQRGDELVVEAGGAAAPRRSTSTPRARARPEGRLDRALVRRQGMVSPGASLPSQVAANRT